MKKRILFMGLISGLLSFFGCGEKISTDSESKKDSVNLQTINPNNILFTTPTLNNVLPEFKEKTDTCAFFHEDEWRQIEFISKDQKNSVDKELSKIKNIYDNESSKSNGTIIGFKNVAVRDLITEPLKVDFNKLKSILTNKPLKVQGLGLENNPGQVKNGFFFAVEGVNYYGILDDKIVTTFCIYSADSDKDLKSATKKLAKLLKEEKLLLVDWRAVHLFDETNIEKELVPDGQ